MEKKIKELPKIRPLMVFPLSSPDGGAGICLRDPEGFSDATLVINHATYLMMTLMDGTRDVHDIQADFMRQTNAMVPSEQIIDLIAKLNQYLFLDDKAFRLQRKRIEESFLHASVRPAAHSGTAYPQTAEELSTFLMGFFNILKTLKPGLRYTGVDVSGEMIGAARRRYPGGDFRVHDGGSLPFPEGSFDLALSTGVLHHNPDYPAMLREMFSRASPLITSYTLRNCRFVQLPKMSVPSRALKPTASFSIPCASYWLAVT